MFINVYQRLLLLGYPLYTEKNSGATQLHPWPYFGSNPGAVPTFYMNKQPTSEDEAIFSLTFIQTHRKSLKKELWGLSGGPQDLDLYPCTNRKYSQSVFKQKKTFSSLWGPKRPQEFLLRLRTLAGCDAKTQEKMTPSGMFCFIFNIYDHLVKKATFKF